MFKKLNKEEFIEKRVKIKELFEKYFVKSYPGKFEIKGEDLLNLVSDNLGQGIDIFMMGNDSGLVLVEIADNPGKNRKECIVWNVLNIDKDNKIEEFDETLTHHAKENEAKLIRIYSENPLPISRLVKKVGFKFTYGVMEKEL